MEGLPDPSLRSRNALACALAAALAYPLREFLEEANGMFMFIALLLFSQGVFFLVMTMYVVHERQLETAAEKAKSAWSKTALARREWGTLRTMVGLATAGSVPCSGLELLFQPAQASWSRRWQYVAQARKIRRHKLARREVNFTALTLRTVGPLIVCGVALLIAFLEEAYITVALPFLQLGPGLHALAVCAGLANVARIYFNFLRTMLTDPGRPQPEGSGPQNGAHFGPGAAGVSVLCGGGGGCDNVRCLSEAELGVPKYCKQCDAPKPPRCHHCKVCRRCVLKMDHHCPFVNTCIGLHNYRYFLMFVLEAALGCLFPLVALTPQLRVLLVRREMEVCRGVHVIVAWLGSLVVCCSLLQLFLFHMHILLRNETTLENMKRCSANSDAHLEDVLENYALVCGEPPPRHRARVERVLRWVAPNVARLVGKGKHKS